MRLFAEDHFVTGDADVELLVHQAIVDQLVTLLLGSLKNQHINFGRPLGKLALPVVESGLGDDDQVRTGDADDVAQVAEEGNGLQRLAETHFISQNTRNTVLMERNQPVKTSNLVIAHEALDEGWRLSEDRVSSSAALLVFQ